MEGHAKYDSTHKYWERAVEADPNDPSGYCELWDMLDELDAKHRAHRARQAAGLEPPDHYYQPKEEMPPLPAPDPEEVKEAAEKLSQMLEASRNNEWQQLGERIRAKILGNGRPAHRPPSADIAGRNARIVEEVEYWRAQKRQMKAILPDIGKRYRLSARAVKEIWDARERKAT